MYRGGGTFPERPDEIWYVQTIPTVAEGENRPYYGWRSLNRMYSKLRFAKQFMSSHSARPMRLFRGTVTWEEVPIDN